MLLVASAPPAGAGGIGKTGATIRLLAAGRDISLRAVSAVSSTIVWTSGEKGTIARSLDGGRTWSWMTIPGFGDRDFRVLRAFDAKTAVAAAAGSPAVIVRTTDGGRHWSQVYRNDAAASFLDGMGFWDRQRGLAYGDPLDGRFLVLATEDGGASWRELAAARRPPAQPGEAGFAASDSSLRTWDAGMALIATGGRRARLWVSSDFGRSWTQRTCPIRQGASSQGIFSVAVDGARWVVVGGDYRRPADRQGVACWSADGGVTWSAPTNPPGGYRSAVEALGDRRFLATGPNGTDLSIDGGATWRPIGTLGFHALARPPHGDIVFLVGAGGRIARFVPDRER